MSALVGVFVSYAALLGAAPAVDPGTVGEDLCALGGPACEEAPATADEPVLYATPAEVDCPAPQGSRGPSSDPSTPPSAGGDCSPPSLDFHYRVSRVPESERPTGSLRPQRPRRSPRPIAACTGLPPEHGNPLPLGSIPPMAMYAVPGLLPPSAADGGFDASARGTVRAIEPLDRPPRA